VYVEYIVLSRSVKDLARLSLSDPVYVSVHENAVHSTPTRLEQVSYKNTVIYLNYLPFFTFSKAFSVEFVIILLQYDVCILPT